MAHYDLGYSSQDCFKDQSTIGRGHIGLSYSESAFEVLIDILTDNNAICWSLSILVALYIMV
jgi:hypothetical protein